MGFPIFLFQGQSPSPNFFSLSFLLLGQSCLCIILHFVTSKIGFGNILGLVRLLFDLVHTLLSLGFMDLHIALIRVFVAFDVYVTHPAFLHFHHMLPLTPILVSVFIAFSRVFRWMLFLSHLIE